MAAGEQPRLYCLLRGDDALPLSYGLNARDGVELSGFHLSEVTDLFTTGTFGMASWGTGDVGLRDDGNAGSSRRRTEPATHPPFEGGFHGTCRIGGSRTRLLPCRSIRRLHHQLFGLRGNGRNGIDRFLGMVGATKQPLHHPLEKLRNKFCRGALESMTTAYERRAAEANPLWFAPPSVDRESPRAVPSGGPRALPGQAGIRVSRPAQGRKLRVSRAGGLKNKTPPERWLGRGSGRTDVGPS